MVYSADIPMNCAKGFSFALLLLVLTFGASGVRAQSGREKPGTGAKANQRPIVPSPSPTPALTSVNPSPDTAVDDGDVIRVNTGLVSIPVRVMDKKGRIIAGLKKENFKVLEDGVEREIGLFSNEEQPFTVALVLDMSYSATFKAAEIQGAAIAFIDQLRPKDRVMVISFDEEIHMLCEATNDRKAIYRAIRSTKIATGTSLYEAVGMVMNDRLRRIDGRKAIILFTDGVDTTSRKTNAMDNLSDAMELDALFYTLRFDTYADVQRMKNGSAIPKPPPMRSPIPGQGQGGSRFPFPLPTVGSPSSEGTTAEDYEKAREYLEELSRRTGGRIYLASNLDNFSTGLAKIASELREFYSLGIYQDEVKPGKVRRLKVKVDQPGLAVRARDNYVVGKKEPGIH